MPLAIRCPQCRQEIQVPASLAGRKAVCPGCSSSFRVPPGGEEAKLEGPAKLARAARPGEEGREGDTSAKVPAAPAGELRTAGEVVSPQPPTVGAFGGADPFAPPKRVARLVVEDSVPAALVLAPDGRLPSLRLADDETPTSQEAKSRGVHPLVLLIILCTSVVVSLALIFVDFGTGPNPESPAKVRARYLIEQEYFAELDDPTPRQAYQLLLREAQRAYARGDYKREQELYRQVLELLRQERPRHLSITGSVQRDRRLEELLIILLSP
ncbi:MAG: hypothetical protein NZ899_03815 [Thermoguttaceae bacterium]|nr:hypothetical protein [Thermoguttaceae bacterium]MDW8077740.1 hypothetical protein [Thermoguttaceae bacterium]